MSEETIFSEVDEELRRDRFRAMGRRYGPYVAGIAVLVVLAVAGNEGWNWYRSSAAARSSDQFYAASELATSGDIEGAVAALGTLSTDGSGAYPVLAKFDQASLLAKEGKPAEAVAIYDDLAQSAPMPRLKQLAQLLAGFVLIDGGDVAAVTARLSAMTDAAHPFRNSAREAIGLTQYAAHDLVGARDTFEAIMADPQVSQDMMSRVPVYLAQLAAEGAPAKPAPEVAPADDGAAPADDAAPAPSN